MGGEHCKYYDGVHEDRMGLPVVEEQRIKMQDQVYPWQSLVHEKSCPGVLSQRNAVSANIILHCSTAPSPIQHPSTDCS
jgi:hypothetical protein